ncbi:MAG: S-layer homology domain-containing protein [Oscillospiraceae bacterium]|nr:S-layer homology domain-containing protein [Oscillospiraceae bacterium]
MSSKADLSLHRKRQGKALRNRSAVDSQIKVPARRRRYEPCEAEQPSQAPFLSETTSAAAKPEKKSRRGLLFPILILLQLALFGYMFYHGRELLQLGADLERQELDLQERTQAAVMEVRYLVPGQEDMTEEVFYGETASLPAGVELDGYTFLGWEDAEGKLEDRDEFPVYRDTVYVARYSLALETEKHLAYLETHAEGILDASGTVSMREFVRALYLLLDTDKVGSGRFLDVTEKDSCYKAAATLKDLGVLSGSRLHPDDSLTRGEMLKALCCFFPASEETFSFDDLESHDAFYSCFCTAVSSGWIDSDEPLHAGATEEICRGEFAQIMNRVLHRDTKRQLKTADVGSVLDLASSDAYYDDLVEAVVPHEYSIENGLEIWTDSEPMPLHEPGFFFNGVKLHRISEDGSPVVSSSFLGLEFNENGEVTSGDRELDRMLWDILKETVDPDKMEQEEMLRAVYYYVVRNFSYRYGHVYERGAEGWAVKEARRMLENRAGNCYCFAALFYELARFVGYDAKLYSGIVYGEQYEYNTEDGNLVYCPMGYTPHGWVEITIDGVVYLFDPEYEFRMPWNHMFKCDEQIRAQYGYHT